MAGSDPTLSLELEALVPGVGDVVAASTQGMVHPHRLARELLRFLRLKVLMHDTGTTYSMSPPLLIDAAWHALLLETGVLASVYEALGVPVVHHSAQQPGGDAAHEARLLTTLHAALNINTWRDDDAAAATPPGTLPARIWSPPGGSILVHIRLLPLGRVDPEVLRLYMPPHASFQDLAAQLQRLSGIRPQRFRTGSPDSVPLHPTRLLRGVLAAEGVNSDGGGGGGGSGSGLHLFATSMVAQPTSAKRGRPLSLSLDGALLTGMDRRAPLHSLLPPAALEAYLVQQPRQAYPPLPQRDAATLDDTRLLAEFEGTVLQTRHAPPSRATLPASVSCPHINSPSRIREVHLPEAWTMSDLQAWADKVPVGPHTMLVDGAPPPAGFCHTSTFGELELILGEPVSGVLNVNIQTLDGKMLWVRILGSSTVEELKGRIQELAGISLDQQRLIWAGKQLEDGQALLHCGVSEESTVHLAPRLRGC